MSIIAIVATTNPFQHNDEKYNFTEQQLQAMAEQLPGTPVSEEFDYSKPPVATVKSATVDDGKLVVEFDLVPGYCPWDTGKYVVPGYTIDDAGMITNSHVSVVEKPADKSLPKVEAVVSIPR